MTTTKIVSADEAISRIRDNDVIATTAIADDNTDTFGAVHGTASAHSHNAIAVMFSIQVHSGHDFFGLGV